MNKKELAMVVALILLIPLWTFVDSRFVKPLFPEPAPPAPTATPAPTVGGLPAQAAPAVLAPPPAVLPDPTATGLVEAVSIRRLPERSLTLANGVLSLVLSNYGAGIQRATLHEYPATLADKANPTNGVPIELDFQSSPALVYANLGLNAEADFAMVAAADGRSATFTRALSPGLTFTRTVALADGYEVKVTDRWRNDNTSPVPLADLSLWLGPMFPLPGVSEKFGPFLGVDARHTGGVGVKHYIKQIAKWANRAGTEVHEETLALGSDWFSAKNKFFAQVLTVRANDWPGAQKLMIRTTKGTGASAVGMVQSGAVLGGGELPAGQSLERSYGYFVGPMHMPKLRALGMNQDDILDFRLWRFFTPVGRLLMGGLNALHSLTGNWGLAVILLTVVVRTLFWPLTHKGTENMKRMSELSPQMKEIREKYKSNPQKMNKAMADFYKENKINPMAGCMPMVVQIPVFIALYGVLRVAVELRFAEFLWVKDLSEPENLFGMGINILPLTMGATMVLQQRMTPSTMDEQQRKIMMMMPIVFLFICYGMPAGLLLYWTTSNLLSIYQTWHMKRRRAAKAAAAPAVVPPATTTLAKSRPRGNKKPGGK
jgi:YidC/Oxa1 family membrane protein insertase